MKTIAHACIAGNKGGKSGDCCQIAGNQAMRQYIDFADRKSSANGAGCSHGK
jgi:hypothetical protein